MLARGDIIALDNNVTSFTSGKKYLISDKTQLERTIQKMFGDKVDTQKYLTKFIKFDVELDEGTYSNQFEEIHSYYFNQFEGADQADIVEFQENIFNGIEARERIEIVEKCHLLHSLINKSKEKMDAKYMCVEEFLTVIKHSKSNLPHESNGLYFNDMFGENTTKGLDYLQEKMGRKIDYGDEIGARTYYYVENNGRRYLTPKDLWGILLGCYAAITESKINGVAENREMMARIKEYAIQFWALLKTIK